MNWAEHFNTYDEACAFFGVDTPAQVEAEEAWWAEIEAIEHQDEHETRSAWSLPPLFVSTDDIPF